MSINKLKEPITISNITRDPYYQLPPTKVGGLSLI